MVNTIQAVDHTVTESAMISVCIEYDLFTSISRGIIGILVLVSNILTIVTLSKTKRGIGQKGKLYVMSLSCADLILAPSILCDLVVDKLQYYCLSVPDTDAITEDIVWKKRIGYMFKATISITSLGLSMATLASISVDRYLAVTKPIFYKHHVTKNKIRGIIIFTWLYLIVGVLSTVISSVDSTPPEKIFFALDGSQVVPDLQFRCIVLPHIYFIVLCNIVFSSVTLRNIRKMDAKKTSPAEGSSFKRTKTFLKMSGMTLVVFFILWTPYLIATNVVDRNDPNLPKWVKDHAIFITYSIMFSNSWINPILYCWFNKDYREAYKQLLNFKSPRIHPAGVSSDATHHN